MKKSGVLDTRGYRLRRLTIVALAFLLPTGIASIAYSAGDLVVGATVVDVSVRNVSPAEAFSITVSGGTGPCANTTIRFPATGSASTDDGMRSVAVAALLSGKQVRAYDYGSGTNCDAADYIRISN